MLAVRNLPGTGTTGRFSTAEYARSPAPAPGNRRSDAGSIRLGERDVAGLLLCGEMYGAPYDLLATSLEVSADRLRGIVARWRRHGYAETGRLGLGPAWCWLTRLGMAQTGLGYTATRPSLARLAHIRAVLAIRLTLQDSPAYAGSRAYWRSERRLRQAGGWGRPGGHVPDAEVTWPSTGQVSYAGECWAIEAELTPKPAGRTVAIMSTLLTLPASDGPAGTLRYDRVVYLTSPAARPVVARAAASLPGHLAARLVIRDLPVDAVLLDAVVLSADPRHARAVAADGAGGALAGAGGRPGGVRAGHGDRRAGLSGGLAARLAARPAAPGGCLVGADAGGVAGRRADQRRPLTGPALGRPSRLAPGLA